MKKFMFFLCVAMTLAGAPLFAMFIPNEKVHQIAESANQAGPFQMVESLIRVSLSGDDAQLAELESGEMYQIQSVQQKQCDCGIYAKFNAFVVSDLLKNHKIISPKSIQTWGVAPLIKNAGTANWVDETTVFADLAETLPGQNVYMLKVEQTYNGEGVQVVPAGSTTDQNALGMDDFWSNVRKENTENVGYFIVNLDNSHWVSVVALKQPGKKGPAFLYLDSLNTPIDNNLLAKHLKPYFESLAVGEVWL